MRSADLSACRALLRGGSRTFFAASFLLPGCVREPASALYAFCRLGDDAVDEARDPGQALPHLRQRLRLAYAGTPYPLAADRAFAEVVARHGIPRALPEALLEGFEWDVAGRRYGDIGELYAYAVRVAGTVGAMMALLMGVRSARMVARACDLGVAMQLTNIARDVGEDARAGRLYLPLDWLMDEGIDPEAWLARPVFSAGIASVLGRLLDAADALYRRADAGIRRLPSGCQPGIYAARLLYAEIGRELERTGMDSISRRAVVPFSRKAALLTRALVSAPPQRRDGSAPPLAQARYLLDAIADAPAFPEARRRRRLEDRVVWVLELFERLERNERAMMRQGKHAYGSRAAPAARGGES